MKKLDLTNKKTNIIVVSILMVLALAVTIITGIEFASFRNYQAEFILREDVVDKVYKFSEFSPLLKGTAGDSNIYVINGTDNTVAVALKDKADKYSTVDSMSDANVVAVGASATFTIAETALGKGRVAQLADVSAVVEAVTSGSSDVAILRFADAKYAVTQSNGKLAILDAQIEEVPSLLVIGGTHPNEPSGQLAATVFLENATMQRGTLYVITELNRSAYTHSQPQEATAWYYDLTTANGSTRTFKYGSRATNTVDQWPTPDVYTHSSGQQLSSSEVRNINRAYPGSPNGTYTERIAYAVTNFVKIKDITMVVDLHEASPEYITINAIVAHQDSVDIESYAIDFIMASYEATTKDGDIINGVNISNEVSPINLHGLTHRELGDYTNAYVFLCETSNASQGKFRGKFSPDLITYEQPDKFYEYAATKQGLLYARPVSINERVARHTYTIESLIQAFNQTGMTRTVSVSKLDGEKQQGKYVGQFIINNLPQYIDILDNGVGNYLQDSAR